MACPCISPPFAITVPVQLLRRLRRSASRYPPSSRSLSTLHSPSTTYVLPACSASANCHILIAHRVASSSRRPHTTSRRLLTSRPPLCPPQSQEAQRLRMDDRLVCRRRRIRIRLRHHSLLHSFPPGLLKGVLHNTPAHHPTAHNPHLCERCCMLCARIPPPNIRQARHDRNVGVHPRHAPPFGGMGICREFHVG